MAQLSKEGSARSAEASCEGERSVEVRWVMKKAWRASAWFLHHSSASCVTVRMRSLRRESLAARTSISEVSWREVRNSGSEEGGGRDADWMQRMQCVRLGELSSGS